MATLSVILLATKSDISEKLSSLNTQVDDFIEKPFFLKDATQRIKRVIDKIALEKIDKDRSARWRVARQSVADERH